MSSVAYTIGAEKSYDRALTEDSPVSKLGVRPDDDPPYGGGWVWRTAEDARAFIASQKVPLWFTPAVYELRLPTGWDVDVSKDVEEDGVHRLLNDAIIVRKMQG